MKLKTPFTVITNPLRDIDWLHDFAYQLPFDKNLDFWKEEGNNHPTNSACKSYDV